MAMNSFKKMIMMANQIDKPSLPSYLVRCEYLEATGTQYIDLGYPLGYENKVEIEVECTSTAVNNFILGNVFDSTKAFTLQYSPSNAICRFDGVYNNASKKPNGREVWEIDKSGIIINNIAFPYNGTPSEFTTLGNIALFAVINSTNVAVNFFRGYFFYCKIYDKNHLLHSYIPCFNTENRRPCIYDTITGIELYNQGTGEFNYHIEGKPIPYLAFEALEDDLQVSITKSATQYSLDRVTWIDLPAEEMTPPIAKGEKVWFKAEITPDGTNTGIGTFSCTKQCNLEGTPMSLLYGDRTDGVLNLPNKAYCFAYLFAYNDKIIRVNNPMEFLPSMTLTTYCYYNTFARCSNLQNGVYLPAVLVTSLCYAYTYSQCISLIEAYDFPKWENTSSSSGTCTYMYKDCISLKKQPYIPDNTYVHCNYMFYGCSNMEEVQEYIHRFYEYMYYGCSNISVAPKLYSYKSTYIRYSFTNNYSLITPTPIIRLAELQISSLEYIYNGCFQIEESPIIMADSYNSNLNYACRYAFNGCKKLKKITFLLLPAPDSTTQYMYQWVRDVASKGTIILNKNIEWNPEDYRGVNGIPEGWEVKYCDPDNIDDVRDYREIDKAWNE